MSFFPFFREIEGAKGLIVGGGKVALRKAEKLLPYGPELTVVAPEVLPEFYTMGLAVRERVFLDTDLTPELAFVIAATGSRECNERISRLCREAGILVNVVDAPKLCSFLFPSLVKRGKLSVGISTSGASPSAAVWLRKEIENLLPEQMEEMLEWLQSQRTEIRETIEDGSLRSRKLHQLFEDCLQYDGVPEEKGAGCVSLVGAGCGGREWMTLEGLRLLRSCDAVVYDDLIDQTLLEEAPSGAEKIYAGKRSHRPSADQEDIQEILVKLARQKKRVVRLKGGDPFVFGRGGEEIQYLNQCRVPWKVVPGISSALAIPAEAGIPVTHRGVSRSVHIMTAHTKEETLRRDLERFADLEGTLVFLMGLESLEQIAAVLIEKGRSRNTPAAVLSGGNARCHCKVTGTLGDIAEKARQAEVLPPAVIVVGNVVALDLYRGVKLPLSGVPVGLTGTDGFQEKMRGILAPFGADPVSLMRGKCQETGVSIPWREVTDPQSKWVVFTSVQGIRTFFARCRKEGIDSRRFAACQFAVIGASTRRELEGYGFLADACPQEYTSRALAEELLRKIKQGERVYLFCSEQGSEVLTERLGQAHVSCFRFDIYRTQFVSCGPQREDMKYVLFGSAGGVTALYQSGYRMREEMQGICIGPVCGEAYRACFGREPVTAETPSAEAMAEALIRAERARRKECETDEERNGI